MTGTPFVVDPPVDPEQEERGRVLFAGQVDFVKGVVAMSGLPPADRPEVCFAGRSNVGKSSLINALTGRKGLARASNTPGRTQEINFFALGPETAWLVDLPGYGFAQAPVKVWLHVTTLASIRGCPDIGPQSSSPPSLKSPLLFSSIRIWIDVFSTESSSDAVPDI